MKKIKIYGTDIETYPLALGTAGFGDRVTEAEAHRQLDGFTDCGGAIVDTAHIYGGEDSKAEKYIGSWLKNSGKRDKIFLSTKGAHPRFATMNISRLSKDEILSDLDGSLKFLNTDHIDLYFLHRDDEKLPVGDMLETLEEQRRKGKILAYGCSNWKPYRMKLADEYAKEHGLQGFTFNQLMWSLADINTPNVGDKTLCLMDEETLAYHKDTGKTAMAFTSIAYGYFTKRQQGIRHSTAWGNDIEPMYDTENNTKIFERLLELCDGNRTVMDYCLAFFQGHDFPAVPLAGFSKFEQFEDTIKLFEKDFDEEILRELAAMKRYDY